MTFYDHLGYTKADLEAIVLNKPRFYITYNILKRSGKKRRIDAPQDPLKQVQADILHKVLYQFKAHPIAHGFVKDKSPVSNAMAHVDKKFVLTVDIKNFFNSITTETVGNILNWLFARQQKFTYDPEDPILCAELLCYRGGLPQGSPASPVMSNLVCMGLDKVLTDVAVKFDAAITRYADDITMSSNTNDLKQAPVVLYGWIRNYKLVPNFKKTRIKKYFQRQQVTGIIVNKQLGAKKEMWRNLRARLHNLKRDNKSITTEEAQQIRGYIEWIKSLNPTRGSQLLTQFSLINVTP